MSFLKGSHKVWSSFLSFFKTNCFERWLSALGYTSEHFWLSLVVLLTIDALVNPYAGIVHDARLYALQALSSLHPGRYAKDLFFLFGSQDSYTIFSPIYAMFISGLGLINGTLVLYVLSKAFFLGSVHLFFRQFCRNGAVAFLAAAILACSEVHYIFFDVNEPFLTPRLAAQAFSLLALTAVLQKRCLVTIVLLLAAALFHPIMAFGSGVAVVMMWIVQKEWQGIAFSAVALFSGYLALLIIKPESFNELNPFLKFDDEWRAIVFERSPYLFPREWPKDEWMTIFASIATAVLAWSVLSKEQKNITAVIVLITVVCVSASMLFTYTFSLALPFQLQFWRAFWLLKILNPVLCLVWGYTLWGSGIFFKKFAAPMIIIPTFMGGGITSDEIWWLIPAFLLGMADVNIDEYVTDKAKKTILATEIALLLLIPLPAIILNYSIYSSLLEWKTAIPAIALVSGPLFPVLALLIVWGAYKAISLPVAGLVFVSVLIFLYWPGVNPANKFASQIEPLRTSEKQQLAAIPIQEWQDKIPPGSLVLANSSIPVEKIWFELDSCGYWSRLQGAGIVFNRKLAIIYAKRRIILEGMVWGRENNCRHFKEITILPDYLIFRNNTKKWCLRKI